MKLKIKIKKSPRPFQKMNHKLLYMKVYLKDLNTQPKIYKSALKIFIQMIIKRNPKIKFLSNSKKVWFKNLT